MSKPEFLDQLLDMASSAAGSDYKLAQLLGTSRQTVSNWRHGHKNCPVADIVLMAEISGLNPEEWAWRALVAQHEGTPKGDKLFRILGKTLAVTGAVIASSGASAHQIFSHKGAETIAGAVSYFVRCIDLLSFRRFNYRSFNLA
jgi:hypothetical protein